MRNSADLRGSRRLSLLCDFIGKVFTDSVNDCKFCPKQCPGCWEGVKRSCQGFLPACCLKAQSPTEEEVRTHVIIMLSLQKDFFSRKYCSTTQETCYSPSCLSKTKKFCRSIMPACFNNKPASPRRGIELSWLTIFKATVVPSVFVAWDVGTDGKMVYNMAFVIRQIYHNDTPGLFFGLFLFLWIASCVILSVSMVNLIFGNPSKSLIRNAHTSVFIASRELESKDVPLPIGDYFDSLIQPARKGLRAESARAVTGRRCPHSGVG